MKPQIAIVNSSSFGNVFPEHLDRLRGFAELQTIKVPINIPDNDFIKILKPFHGIIASVNPNFPYSVLKELDKLSIITRHGIGYNNVDVEGALKLGIVVTKVEGLVERESVAEQAVALMMSAARQIVAGDRAVHEGRWADRAQFIGVELLNKAVGVIGLGNIGSRTAEILSFGFNAKVVGFDPHRSSEEIEKHGAKKVSFEELLSTSELISLHCSLGKDNYHLLGKEQFAGIKRGLILVNTARGELVDEEALLDALDRGIVRCYATDVVEGEPIGGDHRLLKHPKVIVVPHLGGYSFDSLRGMGETMVNNLEDVFVRGQIPANVIKPEMKSLKIKTLK